MSSVVRRRPALTAPVAALDRTAAPLVAALAVLLLAYNNLVLALEAAHRLYVPLNLAATAALLWAARRSGLGWSHLGLEGATRRRGLRGGLTVAAVVVIALGVAAAVPALRPFLEDGRAAGLGLGGLAYHALIRIPLGTALFEEVAFRGVLFGSWSRLAGPVAGALGSSVVFGLWHIRPTLGLLDANGVAASAAAQALAVTAAVAVTFVGGLFFCLLRIRSQSLLAPIVAHAAINSAALVAAYLALAAS